MRRSVFALVLGMALAGAGCAEPQKNQVQVLDNSFSPRTVTVPVGTAVNWSWNGQAPHNVVFAAGSGLPSSNVLNAGDSFAVTFPTPGTFNYECSLHSGMVGTVIVR